MPFLFKPSECKGCSLYNDDLETRKVKDEVSYQKAHAGRGFSNPDGKGTNGVVVFLESLGDNEVDDGLPVRPYAPAGSIFERVINRSPGLSREMFKIYNTVQCQPPWNKLNDTSWGWQAIDHCKVHRERVLDSIPRKGFKYKQRIILALGAVPFKTLTGLSGEYLNITDIRGYPIETDYGVVIGSYHPSHILQGAQKLMGVLMLDIRKAVNLAKEGFQRKPVEYQENPSLLDVRSFFYKVKDNQQLPLAFDIETPNIDDSKPVTEIESIQFSLGPQTGVFFPWYGEYVDIAREILALENDKIGHNVWRFDRGVLKEVGKVEFGGVMHDTLWAFHHYQPDLTIENKDGDDAGISSRMGLQYAASFFGMDYPWKHFKFDLSKAKTYGIADVDATQRIWSKLPEAMKRLGIWDGYVKLRLGLDPVLIRMSERGIPVNEQKRQGLATEIAVDKAQHFRRMQQLVPNELKNFEPKNGYTRDVEKQIAFKKGKIKWEPHDPCGATIGFKQVPGRGFGSFTWQDDDGNWWPCEVRDFNGEKRWVRVLPFKPSNDQIIKYMKSKDYKVPKKKVKDDRQWVETGEQKELVKLYRQTKDALFAEILEYRGCETAESRYVRKWEPGLDGLVHSQFMFVPASGQLNSIKPNAQNFIKHGSKDGVNRKYAARLRGMIEAPEGFKLVECVSPGTKLLMADLTWKTAEWVGIGNEIIGVDEEPSYVPLKKDPLRLTKRRGRYLRRGKVLSVRRLQKECVRISTTKGIITCSKDHYLAKRTSGKALWVEAAKMKIGQKICFFVEPWKADTTFEGGWISGLLDGEGYAGTGRKLPSRVLAFGQNEGIVSDTARNILAKKGFDISIRAGSYKCKVTAIKGSFKWLRVIGMFRPVRLTQKIADQINGMAYWGRNSESATITNIEEVGLQDVMAIETSIHTFIAEGFLSHNCDYKSFHALTTGFEARDVDYMRLARLDIHSFVTAHFAYMQKLISASELPNLKWSDADLMQCLGVIKKRFPDIRDTKAKPADLGYGFGMGPNKLYQMNEDTMTLKDAKTLMKLLDDLFPIAKQWRKDIKILADRQGYLVSRFGFIRWFWDVFSRKKVGSEWVTANGSDAEDSIAFLPSNSAHGHIQGNMIRLDNCGYNELYWLINMVHDSLLYLIPNNRIDEAIPQIKSLMEEASPVLVDSKVAPNGLSVAVDVKIGNSWDNMKEVKC